MLGPKFGKALRAMVEHKLRGLQLLTNSRPDLSGAFTQAFRNHMSISAAGNMAAYQQLFQNGGPRLGTAMLLGGSAAVALTQGSEEEELDMADDDLKALPWVEEIAVQPGVQEVSCPGLMLRNHPIGKLVTKQDHLFGVMMSTGQIKNFICYYNPSGRQFYSVVHFGREVCGYPETVHGGLSAAVLDETLGGLCISLWKSGALGFRPPAYTARLEVDYKAKVPSGAVVLCSTEVESIQDRKVWMKAKMTDGKGTVYATARALFVSPKVTKLVGLEGRRSSAAPTPTPQAVAT